MRRFGRLALPLSIALLLVGGLAQLGAQDAPESTVPSSAPETDSALEQKYSAEYRRKVDEQTARVQESYDSLFAGLVAVFVSVGAIALFCVWRTRTQANEIEALRADATFLNPRD